MRERLSLGARHRRRERPTRYRSKAQRRTSVFTLALRATLGYYTARAIITALLIIAILALGALSQ